MEADFAAKIEAQFNSMIDNVVEVDSPATAQTTA
jgi:hypothetical protein